MSDRVAILNKIQETFIIARTHYEQTMNQWLRYLGTLPEDIYNRIVEETTFTKDMTCRDIVPEWWERVPNKEKVHEQVTRANQNLEIADAIINEIMEEGLRIAEEFNKAVGNS